MHSFISELTHHIKTHNAEKGEPTPDDNYFDWYLPVFVFALRDFHLEKIIAGKEITSQEYMEHCLKLKEGEDKRAVRNNASRLCIRKYFRKRFCFTFDRPTTNKKLRELETLPDSALSEDFVKEMSEFVSFVNKEGPVKKLDHGQVFNGRSMFIMFYSFIVHFSSFSDCKWCVVDIYR